MRATAEGRSGQLTEVVPNLDPVVVATCFDDRDPLRLAKAVETFAHSAVVADVIEPQLP